MTERARWDSAMKHQLYGRVIEYPRVDANLCTGCKRCSKDCPARVFEIRNKKSVVVSGIDCIACGHCWAVCPEKAVTQRDSVSDEEDFAPEPPLTTDALETFMKQRRSVRHFKSESIPRDVLERIANAGQYAATGSNRQNVHLVVVPTPEKLEELRGMTEGFMRKLFKKLENPIVRKIVSLKSGPELVEYLKMFDNRLRWLTENGRPSPYYPLPFGAALILSYGPDVDSMSSFNCITALQSCAMVAQSEGIGHCYLGFVIMGANRSKTMRQWLGIPKGHSCHSAMVLGYPDVKYLRPVKRVGPKPRWV